MLSWLHWKYLYFVFVFKCRLTTLKIDEEIVSIFRSRDQRPLNNLSRCLKSHLSISKLFSTNQTICIQKYNLWSNTHTKCEKMQYSPLWNTIAEGNKYWERHVEIQKLILIDFTGLNGGIKKGSIDAILLSIEMIEKGFCTATGFPAENSHNKASFCFRGC